MTTPHDDPERARRFREAALPHLDDVYTLARYLLRHQADAEDAVQECYLRAYKHFDTYRGPAIKPWLFAILRNVCHAEFARRAGAPVKALDDAAETTEQAPLWQDSVETPEGAMLRISVEGGGCSGFQYKFDIDRAKADDDLVIARDRAVVLVDPASVPFLAGSEVDFVDDLMGASFRINNPNATASCGCGTSFSV
ncbi:MAG: iron-sulfur cluster assembly accessory protein [Bradyrhizobium sp.]|nr:iron-sulfur cluster assembly accessory protein [Bradyrhizobium sp.]